MQSGASVKAKPKKNGDVVPRVYVFQPDKSVKKGKKMALTQEQVLKNLDFQEEKFEPCFDIVNKEKQIINQKLEFKKNLINDQIK